MNEGTARFRAHGGEGRLRVDGSAFSEHTDTEAFAAEEFVARVYGVGPDRTVGHNDKGYDFVLTVGSISTGFHIEGWAMASDLLDRPLIDFGYGPKHAMPIKELRT